MIGQRIAHYEITAKLGEGGMGEVYRATDTKLNRDVALKILPQQFASDSQRMGRFQREAEVLASLDHPNIGAIHGIEKAGATQALVLQLIEGPTLADRIAHGPLAVEEALPIALQISEALEAAHEKGIIHRDLKPANVKLTPEGQVKVLDFGLAKAMENDPQSSPDMTQSPTLSMAATQAGLILGTAAYMSPEQARGKPVDRRTDIWAFGVVLYEMLTGRQPFRGDDVSQVMAFVITQEVELTSLAGAIPLRIQRLLARCLDKEPTTRLRDIGEARISIQKYCEDPQPEETTAVGAAPEPAGWKQVLPWSVAGAAILMLAVMSFWGEPAPGANSQTLRLAAEFGSGLEVSLNQGVPVDISPDGSTLVLNPTAGGDTLFLRRLDQLIPTPLASTEAAVRPFFSADGQWIAFYEAGRLKKVSITGGTPLALSEAPNSRGGTWGENGDIVFTPDVSGPLWRVPDAGGQAVQLTQLDEQRGERTHRWPQFLPGGQQLLFVSNTQPSRFSEAHIELLDVASGARKTLFEGGTHPKYLASGHIGFLKGGTLFAIPFDADRGEVTGVPAPLVEGVAISENQGDGKFAVSGNGTLIYQSGDILGAATSLTLVDLAGNASPVPGASGQFNRPAVSPDGRRVALQVDGDNETDIWVFDLDRSTLTRLTFGTQDSRPLWAPDGEWIYFSRVETGGAQNIQRKRADGSGEVEQITQGEGVLLPYSADPEGQRLAVVRFGEGAGDIGVLDLGSGEIEWLLESEFHETDPSISPDGRWLAYTSNGSGDDEVYVTSVAPSAARWQISSDGGGEPRWYPDGSSLFFRDGDVFFSVSIAVRGESIVAGRPEAIFSGSYKRGAHYDVTPDGSFVTLQGAGAAQQDNRHFHIIINWFAAIERMVGK